MTYYQVAGTYNFTHYGEALSFARRINKPVVIKKTYNIFKIMYAAI